MEDFKKDIDEQHAPNALVDSTIERIHQISVAKNGTGFEKNRVTVQKNDKEKKSQGMLFACAGIVAVCILALLVTSVCQPQLVYNEVVSIAERDLQCRTGFSEITLEEYEQYLKVDIEERLNDYTIEKERIFVCYDSDSGEIVEDEGIFYLKAEERTMVLKISQTGQPAPEEILSGETSDINGVAVFAGRSKATGQLIAAFEVEGVKYYLVCEDMPKRRFKNILKYLLR